MDFYWGLLCGSAMGIIITGYSIFNGDASLFGVLCPLLIGFFISLLF